MKSELRDTLRLYWNTLRTDWMVMGALAFSILMGLVVYFGGGEGSMHITMVIPLIMSASILLRMGDADRVRPLAVLPVSGRALATHWWLVGNITVPGSLATLMLAVWLVDKFFNGGAVTPFARLVSHADAFLMLASGMYAALLVFWQMRAIARAKAMPMIERLGWIPLAASYWVPFLTTFERWDWLTARWPLVMLAGPVLAAGNAWFSYLLLPSHNSLQSAIYHIPAQKRAMPLTSRRAAMFAPIREMFIQTLFFGFIIGFGGAFFLTIIHGGSLLTFGADAYSSITQPFFIILFPMMIVIVQWQSALRALRALPISRQMLGLVFGLASLAVSLAIALYILTFDLIFGIPVVPLDLVSMTVLLTGLLWLILAVASLLAIPGHLLIALVPMFWILPMVARGHISMAAIWPLGLLMSMLAWYLFDRALGASRVYRVQPVGTRKFS